MGKRNLLLCVVDALAGMGRDNDANAEDGERASKGVVF